MSDKKIKVLAVTIVSIAVILAITSFWNDSLIVDEIPHIGAGYSYLVKQDFRLNPEHPPLAKNLAALPLSFLNLNRTAFETKPWQTDINGQWEFGKNLIFNSGNNAELITRLVKFPMILFFVLSAFLIFKWTKKLYGNNAALIALTLFSFSPTVLAHARFVATDVPALFGILFASYFFITYLQSPGRKNFWLASIAFGVALVTKFSTFLLIPYFLILAMVWGLVNKRPSNNNDQGDGEGTVLFQSLGNKTRTPESPQNSLGTLSRTIWRTILIFIAGLAIIVWPLYFFNTLNYPTARQKADTINLLQFYGNRTFVEAIIWASDKPLLKPLASYGLGLLMVNQRAAGGNTTYFLGEVSRFGWKHYFPVVYFIKEPLAWWGLVFIALLSAGAQIKTAKLSTKKVKPFLWITNHFTEFAMFLWLLIYWSVSLKSTLNIGVRHLLPTYPFAILLVSGQLVKLVQNLKEKIQNNHVQSKILNFKFSFLAFGLTFSILLSWYIIENIKIWPHYLAYFNQSVGGASGGYRYVTDSNLDWGQDLKRFAKLVEKNNLSKVELDYFGWSDPSYYLGESYIRLNSQKYKNAEDFRARNQTNSWLAISATFLQGSQGPPDQFKTINYLWLKAHQPVVVIGHSIFVYQIK